MVRVDAARAVAVGLLGVAVLADAATLPLLYAVFFALGTAETLFDNVAISILPAVAPGRAAGPANGRLLGAHMVANELVAPPLGGLPFAIAAAVPLLLDAGTSRPRPPWSRPWAAASGWSGPPARPDHPAERDRRGGALAALRATGCCASLAWPSP